MNESRYPCTGPTLTKGFGAFLDAELSFPRRNIQLFTKELEKTLGVEHISLVNSGSSANLAGAILVKENVPGKKKVLMSAFSFPTLISSFELLGFEVELVDVETNGFNISVDDLTKKLDNETASVCITHFLGFPADVSKVKDLCIEKNAMLVQDACETMNLKVGTENIYSFGDIITHSFYHPHHLSSFGGGAVICPNNDLFRKAESVIHWGRSCTCHFNPSLCTAPHGINHNFWYERLGVNVEISELNACFGRFQLQTWENQEALRNRYYNIYFEKLKGLKNIKTFENTHNISPFVFPFLVPNGMQDSIAGLLADKGVETRSLMGGAIYKHPAFKHLDKPGLENSLNVSNSALFVGVHQTLTEQQVDETSAILFDVLSKFD